MSTKPLAEMTAAELGTIAKALDIPNRSKMKKAELLDAIRAVYLRIAAEERATPKRMTNVDRMTKYRRQNGHDRLTPRQRKACRKARNRAEARGEIIDGQWTLRGVRA